MTGKHELDEHLEVLYHLWELHDLDRKNVEEHEPALGRCLDELEELGLVRLEDDLIALTEAGLDRATRIVRRHRIAERLLSDVMHMSEKAVEEGACEFEHMGSDEVTDSICTLLGHPRTCIHGMPIPEGDCCRAASAGFPDTVVPLGDVPVGCRAKIAVVKAPEDSTHHRLAHLDLVPGNVVRIHQKRPSLVVAHEGHLVAMDEGIARSIHVWIQPRREGDGSAARRGGLARSLWSWIAGAPAE